VKEFWIRIEQNPRFFTFFWGALGSFAVWLIVEFSGTVLLYLGTSTLSFLTGYINSRYARSATLQNTTYSYFILSLIFVVVAFAWANISSKISSSLKEPEDKNINKDAKVKPTPKWVPHGFLLVKIMVWFYLLMALFFLAGESIVLNATSDFRQHMRIIAPYISDQEEEAIFSEWSQMDTLEDYNNIYKNIIPVAKDQQLLLRRNHHY